MRRNKLYTNVRISYLEQLVAENRRLKEQSVASADVAEASGPTNAER